MFSRFSVSIEGAPEMDTATLQRSVTDAYRLVFEQLAARDLHLVRTWAAIPGIHESHGEVDRYMVFNGGRFAAYSAWLGGREEFSRAVTTASAVGSSEKALYIHCLAARESGIPVDNPRQVPAYRYSRQFGPLPPCFARATLLPSPFEGSRMLLVGGTASIVGEQSMHLGDLSGQIDETFRNLAAVVASACGVPAATEDRAQQEHLLVGLSRDSALPSRGERARPDDLADPRGLFRGRAGRGATGGAVPARAPRGDRGPRLDASGARRHEVALNPGAQFGPYTILGPLGRGGMASVYKCHEPALDRHIALKVLPREFLHDENFAERFRREAKVIARLEHPNIVPIFAFGIEDGVPWMAMRCIAGGSLSGLLKDRRIDERRVLGVLRGVAEALDYAHSQGIVHRDVKPQNILLDDAGRVYLADFGIAKMAEASGGLTATGMITGTPQYMAPEQAKGVVIDNRADIYALGVVAYELLTGQIPFAADTPIAVLMKHLSEPVPRPSVLDVTEAASDALLKCLAKEPADRWPTAVAFVDALERGLGQGVAPTLVPLAPTEPQPRTRADAQGRPPFPRAPCASVPRRLSPGPTSKGGWLIVGVGGAVALLLGLPGLWLFYESRRAPSPAEPVAEAVPDRPLVTVGAAGAGRGRVAGGRSHRRHGRGRARRGRGADPHRDPEARPPRPTAAAPPAAHAGPAAHRALRRRFTRRRRRRRCTVPPATPTPVVEPTPSVPAGDKRLEGTIAFTPGALEPYPLQSGAVNLNTVRFTVKDGKSGRFKRMVANNVSIATVQAAVELLRKPKGGDWDVVVGVELLDDSAQVIDGFEEKFGIEDDKTTVNLVHELSKDDLARVTRARLRLQATTIEPHPGRAEASFGS